MRKLWVLALTVSLVVSVGVVSSAPTGAATGLLTCNAAASTTIVRNQATTRYVWTIVGRGTCTDNRSSYLVDLSASGTSDTLGACTGSDVANLDLNTVLTLVSTTTGKTEVMALNLGSPTTTYPVTTPFLVTRSGDLVGAGTLFTRLFLACPPLGTPSTAVYFEVLA